MIKEEDVKTVIIKTLEYEKSIPRMDFDIDDEEYIQTNLDRWKYILDWFYIRWK